MSCGKLFVISGPSGSGKTSIVEKLLENTQLNIQQALTYTTRQPREDEQDGVNYHFVSVDEFQEKRDQNFFLEWSSWYDNYYGSPVSLLDEVKKGSSYIMVVDRFGARDILAAHPEAILMWIEAPSLEVLRARLIQRNDAQSSIESRLQKAAIEIEQEKNEHIYKYHIINDRLDDAAERVASFIEKETTRFC